jgi:hypothetical protein
MQFAGLRIINNYARSVNGNFYASEKNFNLSLRNAFSQLTEFTMFLERIIKYLLSIVIEAINKFFYIPQKSLKRIYKTGTMPNV